MCGAATYALARSARASATTGRGPDGLVATGVLAIGALAAAWLALGCAALLVRALLASVGRVPAALDRAVVRTTPGLLRRVVTLGVGAGLAVGPLALPAIAVEAPPPIGWQVTDGRTGSDAPSPAVPRTVEPTALPTSAARPAVLPTPPGPAPAPAAPSTDPAPPPPAAAPADATAPAATPRPATAPSSPRRTTATPRTTPANASSTAASEPADAPLSATTDPSSAPRATVVVRAGDCLWSIAAAHLPAGASDAEIAAAWPAWYAANAATVGPDPDLLVPGQVLVVPQAGAR